MNKATSLIIASLLLVSAGAAQADSGDATTGSRTRMDNSATGSRGGDAATTKAGGQTGTSDQ